MTTSPAPSSSAGQPAAQGQRRSARPGEPTGPGVEFSRGLWRLRSLEPSRQVLRSRHKTTQAGFTAEYIPQGRLEHRPILIADGPQHDAQRSEVARFFAPAVVHQRYGDDIAACADRLLDGLSGAGGFALDDLALWFTVEVTAGIVGLTHPRVADHGRAPTTRKQRSGPTTDASVRCRVASSPSSTNHPSTCPARTWAAAAANGCRRHARAWRRSSPTTWPTCGQRSGNVADGPPTT